MPDLSSLHQWQEAPLAFQRLDLEGCIVEVNAEWTELTGYDADECIGHAYTELVPADHVVDFERNLSELKQTGRLNGADCFLQRKDGTILNVRIFGRLNEDACQAECMLVDITGFRVTEQHLIDSEERFRSLFDLAPTPIVLHDGDWVVLANRAMARFLGYESAEALAGESVSGLLHPEDRALVAERVRAMRAGEADIQSQKERFLRRDGSVAHGDTLASPVNFEGRRVFHVVVVDLTEGMQAEQALAESENRYRTIFEHSADALIVHDGAQVRFANDAALDAFGIPRGTDVRDRSLLDFVHADSIALVRERLGLLLAGDYEDTPAELCLLRSDGSPWYAEGYGVRLTLQGETLIMTTLRDLTERKRTEAELAGYRDQLEALLAERTVSLERVRKELSAVTTVVSRTVEMRDPYTAGHQRRVASLAVEIARVMGMSAEDIEYVAVAASMHDVGKVSVPAEILSKPSHLTHLEFELVKTHVEAGYSIVRSAELPDPVAEIVYQHHERLDGTGYPRGLEGDELLLGSRIVAVADTVEAMCSHRPYRPSVGLVAALEEIAYGAGTIYDADVVAACGAVVRDGFAFVEDF